MDCRKWLDPVTRILATANKDSRYRYQLGKLFEGYAVSGGLTSRNHSPPLFLDSTLFRHKPPRSRRAPSPAFSSSSELAMILTGRWAYKKYKKRRAEKEELNETAHVKHSDLCVATQEEISNTAVENLGSVAPKAQRSDLPPSYSKIEQDSLSSPASTLHPSSSVKSATTTSSSQSQETSSSYLSHTPLSPATQSRLSGHLSPVAPSPSEMTVGQPTEIQVHGKWVWIPDDAPLPSAPAVHSIPPSIADEGAAAELPTATSLKELPSLPRSATASEDDQKGGFFLAELDSKPVSAGDSDKEVYVTR